MSKSPRMREDLPSLEQKGTLTITTRDHEGRPVAAEVVARASSTSRSFTSRSDYAIPTRGRSSSVPNAAKSRPHRQSSFHQKRFARLVLGRRG